MAADKKKRYTEEEKQQHIEATKGFTFKLLDEYAKKNKLSVHTLRGWHNKAGGKGGNTKAKSKAKTARKSAKAKPARKPMRKAGKRGGRRVAAKRSAQPVAVASTAPESLKTEIADFLLDPAGVTDTAEAERLLKLAHASL